MESYYFGRLDDEVGYYFSGSFWDSRHFLFLMAIRDDKLQRRLRVIVDGSVSMQCYSVWCEL